MQQIGLQARTRGGVFGPGGYGGGIFDGSGMGFGGLGQYEGAASGVRGIGQDVEDWVAEQNTASGPFYTGGAATPYTGPGAPSTVPTTTTAVATYPWNTYSNATKQLQIQANTALEALGQPSIDADGYLGPQTCGAIDYLRSAGVAILKPSTCQSSSYSADAAAEATPTALPATTSAPASSPAEVTEPLAPAPGTSRARMTGLVLGGLAVAAVAGIAVAARKKKA